MRCAGRRVGFALIPSWRRRRDDLEERLERRHRPPLRDVRAVHAEHGLLGLASKPLEFVHWVLPRHPGGREGVLEEMMRILRYVCPGVGGDWPYP